MRKYAFCALALAALVALPAAAAVRTTRQRPDPPAGRHTSPRIVAPEERLAPLFDLASQLSQDRGWLKAGVVSELGERGLWLNEVFTEAPMLLKVDGTYYRIVLERDGKGWANFDPESSPYFVYLTHEVTDKLGSDRVEGFQNGNRSVFVAGDLAAMAAVGISVIELSPAEFEGQLADLKSAGERENPTVIELGAPISLGISRARVLDRPRAQPLPLANKATCPRQIAPTACDVAGHPTCSAPGYSAFFVLDSLYIKTSHETFGSPEIELYPARLDINPAASVPNPTTGLIFSGRYVTDFAGQTVYLPDVNDNYRWYTIEDGLALFKTDSGLEFGATLVDDDNESGKLVRDGSDWQPFKVAGAVGSVITIVGKAKQLGTLGWITTILGFFSSLGGIFTNHDDLYVESLSINDSLFCESAVNQPFTNPIQLDGTEWSLRGHFACINSTCTPAPVSPPSTSTPTPTCSAFGWGCSLDSDCCSGFCDMTTSSTSSSQLKLAAGAWGTCS